MVNNVLFLSRFSNGNINSKPDTYTIWDAYKYGLKSHIENFISFDYYDLYFENGKNKFEDIIENTIKEYKIKYLFIGFAAEDFTIDLDYLRNLKNMYQLCIVNTSQDPETFFESRDRYYNQIADYILPFTVLPNNCIYKYYNLDAITLYSVYNKSMFKDIEIPEIYDVTFIGNVNKSDRKRIIDYLKQNGINIQTYGPGSENGFVNHQKMIEIINSSKINLNFTDSALSEGFDFNTNTNFSIGTKINSRIQQAKGRLIEICLTNSFCLTQEGEGSRKLFDDDRIIFQNKEDLLKKINYYLKNIEEKKSITKELYEQSLKFDAKNRFAQILPKLNYKSKKIDKLYIDKNFIRDFTSYHFLFFFNFFFKRNIKNLKDEVGVFLKYHTFDMKTIWYHLKMQTIYAYKRDKGIK